MSTAEYLEVTKTIFENKINYTYECSLGGEVTGDWGGRVSGNRGEGCGSAARDGDIMGKGINGKRVGDLR